jgi:hypothetical protein
LPDVTLEWLINSSGSLRASFFYRENTDYLNTSVNGGPGKSAKRIGGSFSFRRDFDHIGDIFRKKKKVTTAPVDTETIPPTEENKEEEE